MKLYIMPIAIFVAVTGSSCNTGYKDKGTFNDTGIQPEQALGANEKSNLSDSFNIGSSPAKAKQLSGQVLESGSPGALTDWDKKIIKTADITIELNDYKSFNSKIHMAVAGFGAYIAAEEQNENEDRVTNTISIKVPVDRFEDMVKLVASGEVKVVTKKITTDDVTGDMVDTKSRIEAKKQVRARYLELLKQARNMNEILQVQTEINAVQEGLEAAAGKVSYLVHQSAYSTIHLTCYQYLKAPERINEPTFFSKLAEAFTNGGVIISGFLLTIVTIWPLLLAAVIIWFFVKKLKLPSVKSSK